MLHFYDDYYFIIILPTINIITIATIVATAILYFINERRSDREKYRKENCALAENIATNPTPVVRMTASD